MHFVKAKGLLSAGNGINIYRGCTHGCIYCDSRSLCYQINHNFDDIEVKQNAPELLRQALIHKKTPVMIGTGAMCDPYMQCEAELGLMRSCLEIIRELGFGIAVQTKSDLILRDIDLLDKINKETKAVVEITITTADDRLCRLLEPDVCTSSRRKEVLQRMRERGIPTVVWISPILPFINDTEENLCGVLDICFSSGVCGIVNFGMGMTLRDGNREYYYNALNRYFPGLKSVYSEKYGRTYECLSDNNKKLCDIFHSECEKHGVMHDNEEIFSYIQTMPEKQITTGEQLSLF